MRPINLHLDALKKLGMKYEIKKGYIYATAKNGLNGNNIKFKKISVGATENTIIAASLAKGKTILRNCAIEPEIKDLTNFLSSAGANIKWIGKRTVQIIGVQQLKSTNYTVMCDRIETGTMAIAAALTGGILKIKGLDPKIINTELELVKKTGSIIKYEKNEIKIYGAKKIKNIKLIKTKEYPGFPTDLQAQFMVLLCKAEGRSVIEENIFENRFMHALELQRLGAKISLKKNKAIIEGNSKLEGAELMSSDLRASVALVLAAIASKGKSTIHRIYHLSRGYENLDKKLKKIGVNISKNYWWEISFLKKIIARSSDDLQFISAYSSNSSVKINDIKYLKKNKIFLILLERINQDKKNQKISSILKFEFVDSSKSKNINQQDAKILLKLLAIKLFKVKKNYEITLLFSNNAIINLSAEIIEVTLEDLKEIND